MPSLLQQTGTLPWRGMQSPHSWQDSTTPRLQQPGRRDWKTSVLLKRHHEPRPSGKQET